MAKINNQPQKEIPEGIPIDFSNIPLSMHDEHARYVIGKRLRNAIVDITSGEDAQMRIPQNSAAIELFCRPRRPSKQKPSGSKESE